MDLDPRPSERDDHGLCAGRHHLLRRGEPEPAHLGPVRREHVAQCQQLARDRLGGGRIQDEGEPTFARCPGRRRDSLVGNLEAGQDHRRAAGDASDHVGDLARRHLPVRARGHSDQVLARDIYEDQGHPRRLGADAQERRVDAQRFQLGSRTPAEIVVTHPAHQDRAGAQARRRGCLVRSLPAPTAVERAVQDGLAGAGKPRDPHHQVGVDRPDHHDDGPIAARLGRLNRHPA